MGTYSDTGSPAFQIPCKAFKEIIIRMIVFDLLKSVMYQSTWMTSADRVFQFYWPEKVSAEGTERGLSEEFRHELVTFDLVNFVVFDGAATPGDTPTQTEVVSI